MNYLSLSIFNNFSHSEVLQDRATHCTSMLQWYSSAPVAFWLFPIANIAFITE